MKQLQNMMDYIYHGQVSIVQGDLEKFITTAMEFGLKGIDNLNDSSKHNENVERSENIINKAQPLCFGEQPDKEAADVLDEDNAALQDAVDVAIKLNSDEEDNVNDPRNQWAEESIESLLDQTQIVSQKHTNGINGLVDVMELDIKTEQANDQAMDDAIQYNNETRGQVKLENEVDEMKPIIEESEIYKVETELSPQDVLKGTPIVFSDKMKGENSIIQLGKTFSSVAEVQETISQLNDATFSKYVNFSNSVRRNRRNMVYKCKFGVLQASQSKGIRQQPSKYVGCPAFVNIRHSTDGVLTVVRGNLEHENHEVSEEAYTKIKKKLTKDQVEAVKVILETEPEPTTAELAGFLSNITGKQYSNHDALYVKRRLRLGLKIGTGSGSGSR